MNKYTLKKIVAITMIILLCSITIAIVDYICFAFVLWEKNPSNWGEAGRFIFTYLFLVVSIFLVIGILNDNSSK